MARKRKVPPAVCAGEVSPEFYMRTRAILTHMVLKQKGIEPGVIEVWDKNHPEDRRSFQFDF